MGEIVRFVPKSERERARLIREARVADDSVFPPADPVSEQQDRAPVSHTVSAASCACRKSNPDVFVMQSAEDWAAKNTPCPLNSTR
jgi:hypothetical protein